MEQEQFATDDTGIKWLFDTQDYESQALRTKLGSEFGWTEAAEPTWYTKTDNLNVVHQFISDNGNDLFTELKSANTPERQRQWLQSVVTLKTQSPPTSGDVAKSAGTGTTSTIGTQSAASTSQSAKSTPGPQTARRSAFASRAEAQPQSPSATGGSAQTVGSPSAEPARKSIFKERQAAPDTPSPGIVPEQTAVASSPAVQLEQIVDAVRAVTSDLSADELSSIASEVGLTPERVQAIVQESDFARLVVEEQASRSA